MYHFNHGRAQLGGIKYLRIVGQPSPPTPDYFSHLCKLRLCPVKQQCPLPPPPAPGDHHPTSVSEFDYAQTSVSEIM